MNKPPKPTPKSMNQSRVWSPEGKPKGGGSTSYHWSYIPKKFRMAQPKKWVSKNQEHIKAVYALRFGIGKPPQ